MSSKAKAILAAFVIIALVAIMPPLLLISRSSPPDSRPCGFAQTAVRDDADRPVLIMGGPSIIGGHGVFTEKAVGIIHADGTVTGPGRNP